MLSPLRRVPSFQGAHATSRSPEIASGGERLAAPPALLAGPYMPTLQGNTTYAFRRASWQARFCVECGHKLSRYNPGIECWAHSYRAPKTTTERMMKNR
jgi:hypothetical protein